MSGQPWWIPVIVAMPTAWIGWKALRAGAADVLIKDVDLIVAHYETREWRTWQSPAQQPVLGQTIINIGQSGGGWWEVTGCVPTPHLRLLLYNKGRGEVTVARASAIMPGRFEVAALESFERMKGGDPKVLLLSFTPTAWSTARSNRSRRRAGLQRHRHLRVSEQLGNDKTITRRVPITVGMMAEFLSSLVHP